MEVSLIPHTGHPGRGRDNRLFVNAVLRCVRTGISWRNLPERFGSWNTVARRFRRWARGVGSVVSGRTGTRLRLAEPVIPSKTSRNEPRPYDQNLYPDRNKVGRFFGRLKEASGFATRYEKIAHLLATLNWLR